MLNQVLHEIQNAKHGLNLNDLSRKLDVDRGALDGMIQFLVQKGRLVDDDLEESTSCAADAVGSCGSSCEGPDNCSYIMDMPKTYSITVLKK